MGFIGKSEEIEVVRVLEKLPGKIGLRRWKRVLKVCHGLSLPAKEMALDLDNEDVPAPAVPHGLFDVPQPLRRVFHFIEQYAVVEPRQLCSNLLHN